MLLNILEIVMITVCVLGRIAGTVVIVWLIVTKLQDGFLTPLLVILAVVIGLGFNLKYDNPNNHKPQTEAPSQPPHLEK